MMKHVNNMKAKSTMKTKELNREAMLKNINGLSIGDKAYCGPYGTVTCTAEAENCELLLTENAAGNFRGMQKGFKRNTRKFSVSGATKIPNGGNYTMASLRKAICK